MTRTIVIIHPGALGDVLLAVPALRRIRARFAQHELVLCASEPVAQLLFECREVDTWISFQGRACAGLFDPDAPIEGELQRCLTQCDYAVAWMQDQAGSFTRAMKRAGAGHTVVSSPFSIGLKSLHQSDRFCEAVQELSIRPAAFQPVQLPREVSARGRTYLEDAGARTEQPVVAVHPGSGSPRKSIAVAEMASMMTKFQREGMQPVVIEGPADHEAVNNLLSRVSPSTAVLRGLDLVTLAGALSHAATFLGHDSGVTHLAALLGVQTIAFFGPTDPDRWAPLGSHVTVIKASCDPVGLATAVHDLPTTTNASGNPKS